MTSKIKSFIQYAIILLLTMLLVWFSLRGLPGVDGQDKWDYLQKTWGLANKGWLALMAFVALVSHLVRAERWRLLIGSAGYGVGLKNSFYSLMVGYLVNLVLPRGGEVSRCYNLYKLEKVPVNISFGTVILERIVDVVCMLTLIGVSFLFESKKLLAFINSLGVNANNGSERITLIMYSLLIGLVLIIIFFAIMKFNEKARTFIAKTWAGFRDGLLSVFRLENKSVFIAYSLLIWALYFAMSYTVIKAFPSTSALGLPAVLSLFAIGAIAMAVPLPGGAGSYHVLVPQGLVFLYGLPQEDAIAFTFIFHGWQTLIVIVVGALSLLVSTFLLKRKISSRQAEEV